MREFSRHPRQSRWPAPINYALALAAMWLCCCATYAPAQDRVLGLDVSAWQGNWSQTRWNNIHNVDNRDFVFIRSSRGGTTGYYNQSDPNNNNGQNTLSQRYDDPYFVQNITRATNAGMYAGAYHFSRPDVLSNTGADEADHFIQMAGAWMRPGYLMPVHDFEAGDGIRSDNGNAQFVLDFSNRMYEVMGIRPSIYVNGNYAHYVLGGASPSLRDQIYETHPTLWIARWPDAYDPYDGNIQTEQPSDSISWTYGLWDDYGVQHPWKFWQYTSVGDLNSYSGNLDLNAAYGGTEFLKDYLVPALWMNDSDGEWTTLANWNSGQAPIAPVQGPGQVARVGSLTLPVVRLPSVDDTVRLDRAGADIEVTLSSGVHEIRKLYVHETLNIAGGALTVNYEPSADSTPTSAEFHAPVTIGSGASFSAHTLLVGPGETLSLGGTLELQHLDLSRSNSGPTTLAVVGDATFAPRNNQQAIITSTTGAGNLGHLDLGGVIRTLEVVNGGGATDLTIDVPVVGGSFIKSGAGTLALTSATAYTGDISVAAGQLRLDNLSIDDAAQVSVASGAVLNLNFSGAADLIGALLIAGIPAPAGTWGGLGSGADFEVSFFAGTGTLLVPELPLAGDFNDDGIVDLADYTVWRDNLGGPAGTLANDNSGQPVGTVQYDAWKANLGSSATTASAVAAGVGVPEASTLCMAGACFAVLFAGRCTRRKSSRKR